MSADVTLYKKFHPKRFGPLKANSFFMNRHINMFLCFLLNQSAAGAGGLGIIRSEKVGESE